MLFVPSLVSSCPSPLSGSKVHMLASTVSSKFLKSLAEIEGFQFQVRSHRDFPNLTIYYVHVLPTSLYYSMVAS